MSSTTHTFYAGVTQRAVERIASALDEALDSRALAEQAGLSPFHFHRIFKGMVGETPLALGRRLRMERAAWQLRCSNRPVTEVAFSAGYETHEAFTRAFRACYGVAPSAYRSKPIAQFELAAACKVHFRPDGGIDAFVPRETGGLDMDVTIREMPALRAGAVEHTGPYHQIASAFARLGAIAGAEGLVGQPGMALVALYYDDPDSTSADELRAAAAILLPEGAPLPEGLREVQLPAGRYACTEHVGPYTQLGDAWTRFMGEWLPASGNRVGEGACYEMYLNNPGEVPEQELRTTLYLPLA